MPITADDLKIFASAKMTDDDDAGGARTATVVQDGTVNNAFPDFSEADRLNGRAQVRKLYPSVVDAGTDALLGARLAINDPAADAAVSVALFRFGNDATQRKAFVDALKASVAVRTFSLGGNTFSVFSYSYDIAAEPNRLQASATTPSNSVSINLGDVVAVTVAGVTSVHVISEFPLLGSAYFDVAPALPLSGTGVATVRFMSFAQRAHAPVTTTAIASAAATTVALSSLWARVVPVLPSAVYPASELTTGLGSGWAQFSHGQVPCVQPGDIATISNEQSMAPATLSAGNVVNTGRTNLSQLTVVGNNGSIIARFLRNGPVPAGVGCTADLAAGTLTVSNVTGWSQPVTVKHRIAESVGIASLAGLTATLTAPLGREYPSGSQFATEAPLGDLQPGSSTPFSQQAWTKVWADVVIGAAVPSLYTGAVGLSTGGTDTDRWAVVFTTATQLNLLSERRGQVATGNIASDFIPLNPDTGEPFFTLYAAGWSAPALGNVLRFNTTGAYASVWAIRSRYAAVAAGDDKALLRMRGDV